MIVLGLTGSVAMGKTTTAQMFADEGVPVFDADAEVHRLYDGAAAAAIERAFPGTTRNGRVDRDRLAERVFGDPAALARLESIVHPMVRQAEEAFRRRAADAGEPLVVLNIPLLFETGGIERMDAVLVVTAPPEVQKARILARPNMTEEKFNAMLARQLSDSEKRKRADYVIDTGKGMEAARAEVRALLQRLRTQGAARRN